MRPSVDHRRSEALHFFELRAELKEDEVDAGLFELVEAFGDLFRGTDEARAQASIRNGVVFEGDTLFELRAG